MDLFKDTEKLLEMNPHPAFVVKDGTIFCANSAALQRFISVGSALTPLLLTGKTEYEAFDGDCLCLRMQIADHAYDASVQVYGDMHLFILEIPEDSPELRAMALVAQELRLPLSGMTNLTDELLPIIARNAPETQSQLSQLNRNLYQLLRIVGNMSDAYYYSNLSNPILKTVNLTDFFREHLEKVSVLTESTHIHFAYGILKKDVFAPVNAGLLSKSLYNLISNAIKFTPTGGHVRADVCADKKKLTLRISNSACIPEDILSNPFCRFQRQPGIEDGRYGIGLGMELVRIAAGIHNGTVLMRQEKDGGLSFTMTVSLRTDEPYTMRSDVLQFDTSGGMDIGLIQLSDALPSHLYKPE